MLLVFLRYFAVERVQVLYHYESDSKGFDPAKSGSDAPGQTPFREMCLRSTGTNTFDNLFFR